MWSDDFRFELFYMPNRQNTRVWRTISWNNLTLHQVKISAKVHASTRATHCTEINGAYYSTLFWLDHVIMYSSVEPKRIQF